MCGIAGYISLSKKQVPLDDALLKSMHESIAHRGPDGYGIWKSHEQQIAFVHRRLSIVDLSPAAAQPMLDKEKTVVVSYNGEMYNHLELRKELEALGYHYFSR